MDKITLRALEPSDIEYIYKWENIADNWIIGNTRQPLSKHILSKYLEIAHLDIYENKQIRLMICNNSEPIGTIELFDFDPYHSRAGVGIIINKKKERNKGFAKQALLQIEQFAFQHAGIAILYANINTNNQSSIYLFENCGYTQAGIKRNWNRLTNGKRIDEILYIKELSNETMC